MAQGEASFLSIGIGTGQGLIGCRTGGSINCVEYRKSVGVPKTLVAQGEVLFVEYQKWWRRTTIDYVEY